jgi:hypothetical protein
MYVWYDLHVYDALILCSNVFSVIWQGSKRVPKNKPSQEVMPAGTRSGKRDKFPFILPSYGRALSCVNRILDIVWCTLP